MIQVALGPTVSEEIDSVVHKHCPELVDITPAGHPALIQPASLVSPDEVGSLQHVIERLTEKIRDTIAVGLAAGHLLEFADNPRRIIVLKYDGKDRSGFTLEGDYDRIPYEVIINPELTAVSSDLTLLWESSVSLLDYKALIYRYARVHVTGLDQHGNPVEVEATGFHARALQHLVDQVNGIFFTSRVAFPGFLASEKSYAKYWSGKMPFSFTFSVRTGALTLAVRPDLRSQLEPITERLLPLCSKWLSNNVHILGFAKWDTSNTSFFGHIPELIETRMIELLSPPMADSLVEEDVWLRRFDSLDTPSLTYGMISMESCSPQPSKDTGTSQSPLSRRSEASPAQCGGKLASPAEGEAMSNSQDPTEQLSPLTRAAYEAFESELPSLLQTNRGKCAIYHGSRRLGIDNDPFDLLHKWLHRGYSDHDLTVLPIEPNPPLAHTES